MIHKIKSYIQLPKTRTQIVYELSRLVVSLALGSAFYTISKVVYFQYSPFLGVPFVGEVTLGVLFFALIYYLIPFIIIAVGDTLKSLFKQLLYENINLFYAGNLTGKKTKVPKIKQFKTNPILIDTSVLIDGRFLSIIEEGFVTSQIIVPQFVLDELQTIADSKSKLKRDKGRRGLNILQQIKTLSKSNFSVYPTPKSKNVDKSLVKLAKKIKARIATVDYNLNKVATVAGLKVLNVNSLANSLKTSVIPGDIITLQITKKGKSKNQGVGYLKDGTMVVVENGLKHINRYTNIEIKKVIQKDTGQIIFAHITT